MVGLEAVACGAHSGLHCLGPFGGWGRHTAQPRTPWQLATIAEIWNNSHRHPLQLGYMLARLINFDPFILHRLLVCAESFS